MHAACMCEWLVIITNSWKPTEKKAVNFVGFVFILDFVVAMCTHVQLMLSSTVSRLVER